jgi:hypothetical protein
MPVCLDKFQQLLVAQAIKALLPPSCAGKIRAIAREGYFFNPTIN